MNPFGHIVEQHIEDASFLWVLRAAAVRQPHYSATDLLELENRIGNHLDGIMVSLEKAWPLCLEATVFEESGEAFVLAVTAFRSLETEKIQTAVEFGFRNEDTYKGLISALAWLPGSLCHDWIKKFFSSKDLRHKLLALSACSERSEDPAAYLSRLLSRQDCLEFLALHQRALRAIGEFKRFDLAEHLEPAIASEDENLRFWGVWSSIMLGNYFHAHMLEEFVLKAGPFRESAVELAFRVLPLETAKAWISRIAENPEDMRWVIKATAYLGDPHAVTWLIITMRKAEVSRLAGEAFSLITGIDLEQRELVLDVPDITEFNLDKDLADEEIGEEGIYLDEDEHLPWPNPDKIAALWQKYRSSFRNGTRYFMGKPVSVDVLKYYLVEGCQRQRRAAAIELALMETQQMLMNTERRCG